MIVRKSSNDIICGTCYKYHIWQKGGGIICHGIEGEEEKEEDNNSAYKDDYNRRDDWDPEELVINSEEEEENNDNNNNIEEYNDGYTAGERAYMNVINTLEDDNSAESIEEEEEKDERYYLRENLWKRLQ